MASNHILVPQTTKHGQALNSLVYSLTRVVNDADNLVAIFGEVTTGGDNAALAILLDLSGEGAVTMAQKVKQLLSNMTAELHTANGDVQKFISRLG